VNLLEDIIAFVKSNPVAAIVVIIAGLALGAATGFVVRLAIAGYFGG
jgi:hypothetical protein